MNKKRMIIRLFEHIAPQIIHDLRFFIIVYLNLSIISQQWNLQWHRQWHLDLKIQLCKASKPITIRWIRNGSRQDWKIIYSIELQTIFYEYYNKNHKINISLVSTGIRPLRANKNGFKLIIFHFDIPRKLSIIRCNKYILWNYIFCICCSNVKNLKFANHLIELNF